MLELAVRIERLRKIQTEMSDRDIPALLLTDPIHIRYATGLSLMPLWTAVNYARYAVVPVEGSPVLFEYPAAVSFAQKVWDDVRPTSYWQYRFDNTPDRSMPARWAEELGDLLSEWGATAGPLGIDSLDASGFLALQKAGVTLLDADPALQAARLIKTPSEIELMKASHRITEEALHEFENAITPGISENELLAVFWRGLLARGGEWCYTRLIATGERTNPWFQEASEHRVERGDLIGIDTDAIGPEGYACDISRTFLCGDTATDEQREAYGVAKDFVVALAELCQPGDSYREITERLPSVPASYLPQRYPVFLHGVGVDDEIPFLSFPDQPHAVIPEGALLPGMVISVEFYAGVPGRRDGVKLENQLIITEDGPELMTTYPYDPLLSS